MGTEPILVMLLAMHLALNIGQHQRKTSQTRMQTLGVNGPLQVILLVRKPFDTLLAKYNLQMTGDHIKSVNFSEIIKDKASWTKFLRKTLDYWLMFHKHWLEKKWIRKHVVYCEDLNTNLDSELMKMTYFLGFNVSNDTIKCVVEISEGKFYRKKSPELRALYGMMDTYMEENLMVFTLI